MVAVLVGHGLFSDFVAAGAREQLAGAVERFLFGFLARGAGGARQGRARRNVIGLAMIDVAELMGGQLHLPRLDIHQAFAIFFNLHTVYLNLAAHSGGPPRYTMAA